MTVRSSDDLSVTVAPDAIACPLGDGVAILDTRTNTYFSLNRTGAAIWGWAQTPVSAAQLVSLLGERFDCGPAVAARDVDNLLVAMLEAGLLRRTDDDA